MQPTRKEPVRSNPGCELRIGIASWDNRSLTEKSIKLTWFNEKDGKASRGGEVPVHALPQMLSFAIRTRYLEIIADE